MIIDCLVKSSPIFWILPPTAYLAESTAMNHISLHTFKENELPSLLPRSAKLVSCKRAELDSCSSLLGSDTSRLTWMCCSRRRWRYPRHFQIGNEQGIHCQCAQE